MVESSRTPTGESHAQTTPAFTLARCDIAGVCGPSGLIASARTSDGAFANVLAVNAHRVDAALVQSDVVADAVAGKGAFRGK